MVENSQKKPTHASVPHNPYSDERINWIKSKVETSLQVEFERSIQEPQVISRPLHVQKVDIPRTKDSFLDCLERENNKNLQLLMNYLQDVGPSSQTSSSLLFWYSSLNRSSPYSIGLKMLQTKLKLKIY